MVRRGCERWMNVTSGASISFKRISFAQVDWRRVPGDEGQGGREGKVGITYWVTCAKSEAKAICLVQVKRVGV